jgi:SpoIID/LytB domain protein
VSDKSAFRRTDGSPVRLFLNDGTSVSYYGMLRAVRLSATRVETVNSIGYDQYVQGVVPNEMPATWPRAATDAQAVAARTYGDWQVHQPMNANYDICDNSNCQVYGGHTSYDKSGKVTSTDFPQAANDTAGQVLRYNSGPVFAQFSASDGGWTVANPTFPYLTAQADTYDKYVVPGSPATITVAALAKQLKLTKIIEIDLVRDGNGGLAAWNGRVVSGTATDGTQTVSFTGEQFQQDVNNAVPNVPVDTTWIQLTPKP